MFCVGTVNSLLDSNRTVDTVLFTFVISMMKEHVCMMAPGSLVHVISWSLEYPKMPLTE